MYLDLSHGIDRDFLGCHCCHRPRQANGGQPGQSLVVNLVLRLIILGLGAFVDNHYMAGNVLQLENEIRRIKKRTSSGSCCFVGRIN